MLEFVDRVAELSSLTEYAREGAGVPIYLYGPEGCGKTRLLREFASRLRAGSGYLVAYIDALEDEDPERAVYGDQSLKRTLINAVKDVKGPIGVLLSKALVGVFERIESSLVRGKHVVVIVDDVAKPMGVEGVEDYMKRLLGMIEHSLASKEPASILIIASTSEGASLDIISRHPTWASVKLLWNLDLDGYVELAGQLRPPHRDAISESWRMTGGNPRALIEVATTYKWRVDEWVNDLRALTLKRLSPLLASERLRLGLEEIIRDIDAPVTRPRPEVVDALKVLEESNLVTYKGVGLLGGKRLPRNEELGIGEYYAWQVPAYRTVIEDIIRVLGRRG